MDKLIKTDGQFFLFKDNGTYVKVSEEFSDLIEEEIKKRLELELRFAKYNSEFDSEIQSKLIVVITQLDAARKHIKILTVLMREIIDLWSKGGNFHGHILRLKNEIELVSRWIDETSR